MERPAFWRIPRNRPDPDDEPFFSIRRKPKQNKKALAGTPSEGELKPGDVITKIGNRDARYLSHTDAQNLIKNAGNTVVFQVERPEQPMQSPVASPLSPLPALAKQPPVAVATNGAPYSAPAPLQVQTNSLSPRPASGPNGLAALTSPPLRNSPVPPNFAKAIQSPVNNLPVTTFPPPLPTFVAGQPPRPVTPECIDMQPYRTTPLVLPGAKVKREVPTTSYLKHHPNPAMRASPQTYDPNLEVLMKQKVVSKQFNSPIGLYSEENIADTVQAQTGLTPQATLTQLIGTSIHLLNSLSVKPPVKPSCVTQHSYKGKKTLYYDPAKSETFKALKDSELGDTVTEVPEPIQPKVFTPQRHIQPSLHQMQGQQQRKSPQPQPVNVLGDDKIHQSYSFRRLMNEVLGESEF